MNAKSGGVIRGRGTGQNPRNRFETLTYEKESWTGEDPGPSTEFLKDHTRSIIATNDSPDVGFDAGVNPYRAPSSYYGNPISHPAAGYWVAQPVGPFWA